jgi:SAM-dependent methyltransferase
LNTSPDDATFAWDQYWHDGRLASCGGEGGTNYQPAIAEGWRRFFDTLEEGARILDVCSGNGAVARLAADAAKQRNLNVTIDAVDSAEIRPGGFGSTGATIRFLPRIQAENLPFPDAAFDVIVGQYAIEYTDVERTLAELRRVSRPLAAIRFVTHAAGSVVVQGAKEQIDDADRLLETGIFEAAEALARSTAGHPYPVNINDARANFRHALQSLEIAARNALDLRMYQNAGNVIVHAIQQQPRVGPGPVLDKIRETALAIRAHHARLTAMRHAALDEMQAESLATMAERLWERKFELAPLLRSDGATFGWVLASN